MGAEASFEVEDFVLLVDHVKARLRIVHGAAGLKQQVGQLLRLPGCGVPVAVPKHFGVKAKDFLPSPQRKQPWEPLCDSFAWHLP